LANRERQHSDSAAVGPQTFTKVFHDSIISQFISQQQKHGDSLVYLVSSKTPLLRNISTCLSEKNATGSLFESQTSTRAVHYFTARTVHGIPPSSSRNLPTKPRKNQIGRCVALRCISRIRARAEGLVPRRPHPRVRPRRNSGLTGCWGMCVQ
jgi:hypothetical protein